MEIVPNFIFPTAVWSTLFDDRGTLNAALLEQIYRLRDQNPKGVANTNVKGWQSPNNIQTLPEFEDLSLRIVQVCQRIGESQHFMPDLGFNLQAWVNINPPGASNKIHYHANCHFSGIYYVSLKAPECGSIFFGTPVASRMLTYPATQATDFTTEEVRMKPEAGECMCFPGGWSMGWKKTRAMKIVSASLLMCWRADKGLHD